MLVGRRQDSEPGASGRDAVRERGSGVGNVVDVAELVVLGALDQG